MAELRPTCSVEGCNRARRALGFCDTHYARWRRNGTLEYLGRRPGVTRRCSIPGCGKKHFGNGYCLAHNKRFKRHGDPLGGGTGRSEARHWLLAHLTHTGDDCIEWPFAKAYGYGVIGTDTGITSVARRMCVLMFGPPIDSRLEAAHSCGNGHLGCVNPNHLRWATPLENSADAVAHGSHTGYKLDYRKAAQIRAHAHLDVETLGHMFGVNPRTIADVLKNRTWVI